MEPILKIIFIIAGLAGMALVFKLQKAGSQGNKKEPEPKKKLNNLPEKPKVDAGMQEIAGLAKLAAADGVLTGNETEHIHNRAAELGIEKKIVSELLENEIRLTESDPETRMIDKNKESGNIFEGYIASRFNKAYFTLKNWAGDKYYQGIYAEATVNPDLLLCFRMGNVEENFAVECKYRSYYYQSGIEWTKENQIETYRRYESESKIPVFIAIGVGGTPDDPNDLFLIPLREIESVFLPKSFLIKYRKLDFKTKNFFFDYANQILL